MDVTLKNTSAHPILHVALSLSGMVALCPSAVGEDRFPTWNGNNTVCDYGLPENYVTEFDAGGYGLCRIGVPIGFGAGSQGREVLHFSKLTPVPYTTGAMDIPHPGGLFVWSGTAWQTFASLGASNSDWVAPTTGYDFSTGIPFDIPGSVTVNDTGEQTLCRYFTMSDSQLPGIDDSTKKYIILIHGWNRTSGHNMYQSSPEFADLEENINHWLLHNGGDDWKVLQYRMEADTDTGGLSSPNGDGGPTVKASRAAEVARLHGYHMAKLILEKCGNVQCIQLIAHSAGSWAARSCLNYLLHENPSVVVQMTLLDAYIPAVNNGGNPYSNLSTMEMNRINFWAQESPARRARIHRLDNYFANDSGWIDFVPGTQETFSWDDMANPSFDGIRTDVPGWTGEYRWDGHHGPIYYYADSVVNFAGYAAPPDPGGWQYSLPYDDVMNVVDVTVSSSPAGQGIRFRVDGVDYTAPQAFRWRRGDPPHTLAAYSSDGGYNWSAWSDGEPISHPVSPSDDRDYVVLFVPGNPSSGTDSVTLTSVSDTFVVESQQIAVRGGEETMSIGGDFGSRRRCLVKFDLSGIPAGSTIQQATLRLHSYYCENPNARQTFLGALGQPWTETGAGGATWLNQPLPSGDIGIWKTFPSAIFDHDQEWSSSQHPSLLAQVAGWHNGARANHGFLLEMEAGFPGESAYRQREYGIAGSRPKLLVSYTPPPTGSLTVSLQTADARTQGARWKLNNGPDTSYHRSGYVIPNLPVGNYTISFKPIPGWDLPATEGQTVVIGPGSHSRTDTYLFAVPIPSGVAASDGTYTDRIQLSWNAAAGASSYEIYRSQSGSVESASLLAQGVLGASFADFDATYGAPYFYWILARNSSGTTSLGGGDSGGIGWGLASTSLPSAMEMNPYSAQLQITNGAPPHVFTAMTPIIYWSTDRPGEVHGVPEEVVGAKEIVQGGSFQVATFADAPPYFWGDTWYVPDRVRNHSQKICLSGFHGYALLDDSSVASFGEGHPSLYYHPRSRDIIDIHVSPNAFLTCINNRGEAVIYGSSPNQIWSGIDNIAHSENLQNIGVALLNNGQILSYGLVNPPASSIVNAVSISLSSSAHALALRADGEVMAWGSNGAGQAEVPPNMRNIAKAFACRDSSYALDTAGILHHWGNDDGKVPPGLKHVKDFSGGSRYGMDKHTIYAHLDSQACLPPGLMIAANGVIQGTPTRSGTYEFWVHVQDFTGRTQTQTIRLDVQPSSNRPPEAITASPSAVDLSMQIPARMRFEVAASDPEGIPVSYNWFLDGSTMVGSSNHLDYSMLSGSFGTHRLCCMLSDGFWTNVTAKCWDLLIIPPSLQILGDTSRFGLVGHPLNWQLASSGGGFPHKWALESQLVAWGDYRNGGTDVPDDLGDIVQVVGSTQWNTALKSDGTVVSWGGYSGGFGSPPPDATNIVSVSMGQFHHLAINSSGRILNWGSGFNGAFWTPLGQPPADLTNIVEVLAGYGTDYALTSEGVVRAWNLGATVSVPMYSNVVKMAATWEGLRVLKNDGTIIGHSPAPTLSNVSAIANHIALLQNGSCVDLGEYYGSNLDSLQNVGALPGGSFANFVITRNGAISAFEEFLWPVNNPYNLYDPYDLGAIPQNIGAVVSGYCAGRHNFAIRHPRTRLPRGLNISRGGFISGIPQSPGTNLFNVVLTDAAGVETSLCHKIIVYDPMSDDNLDGLPNAWSLLNDFDPAGPRVDFEDPDTDGLTNWQEYVAGTRPRDASSTLRLAWESPGAFSGVLTLHFDAVPGRTYALWKDTGGTGAWLPASPQMMSTGTLMRVDVPVGLADRHAFYRLQVFGP